MIAWSENHGGVKPAKEIFVVDDDKHVQELVESALAPEGFPVITFDDGDSFLGAARSRVPLCAFVDVVMPRRSGLEVVKELRAQHCWTPIFFTSARDDVATVVEAMKSGADDYITKPFDPRTLALRVRDAVEMWSLRERERRLGTFDFQSIEKCEWFPVTPSERDILLLTRLMKVVA
jgi:DNA-binding response OmpR family regulator